MTITDAEAQDALADLLGPTTLSAPAPTQRTFRPAPTPPDPGGTPLADFLKEALDLEHGHPQILLRWTTDGETYTLPVDRFRLRDPNIVAEINNHLTDQLEAWTLGAESPAWQARTQSYHPLPPPRRPAL